MINKSSSASIPLKQSSPPAPLDLRAECNNILKNHRLMISGNVEGFINGSDTLQNPRFPSSVIVELCKSVGEIFSNEPTLIRSSDPTVIVGDIHGHLFDVARIFMNFGYPPSQRYLFLGDFVDRGEFSTECIILIYALKYLYPSHIMIIRGNHEFLTTSSSGGFSDEVEQLYPRQRLFYHFNESFQYMPLAALLYEKILCVHGGPCPELIDISQLDKIRRPIEEYDDPLICGILWSDPSFNITHYMPSRRGTGWLFGNMALAEFLEKNGLKMLVRGHECVQDGFEKCFDGQLLTVFSASNYCGSSMNKSAVIFVSSPEKAEPVSMEPLGYMRRSSSKLVYPLNITNQELNNLKVPEVLRLPSVIVGNVVNPNTPLCQHLKISKKLKSITRYRQHTSESFSPIIKIDPFISSV